MWVDLKNTPYLIKEYTIMLILTRYLGETIRIDDDIQISVVGIKGSQVRLGISAPEDTSVHRLEIYQQIQLEKQRALEELAEESDRRTHGSLYNGSELISTEISNRSYLILLQSSFSQ